MKTQRPRRNPMAGSLSNGAYKPKIMPTAKQKEARRRRPKHPSSYDDNRGGC